MTQEPFNRGSFRFRRMVCVRQVSRFFLPVYVPRIPSRKLFRCMLQAKFIYIFFFTTNGTDLAYALTTGASKITSAYDMKFKKVDFNAPTPTINNAAVADGGDITVKLNKENVLTFDNSTSVYKSAIIIDENIKQNWGITVDGNKFIVSKYYDVQTIPPFPVYVKYFDLKTGTSTELTVNVRLERSIADMVTLDAVNHTITADPAKDNFSVSLTPMFDAMTTEQLNEWN